MVLGICLIHSKLPRLYQQIFRRERTLSRLLLLIGSVSMLYFFSRSRSIATSQSGFTLIELMISISIFSIMMLSAFEVYTQVMSLSRKLEVQREVQESARAITEAIAKDVREKGFVITDPSKPYQT